MARILVEIDDPLGLEREALEQEKEPLPVLLKSYVDVEVAAATLENVVELPRAALRDGERAFIVDDQGRLRIRELQIAWRYPHSVLVRGGLKDGDEVVTSRIAAPVDGMSVRKAPSREPSPPAGQETPAPPAAGKPALKTTSSAASTAAPAGAAVAPRANGKTP